MFKRNQIMITALTLMIAVAGYLNFAGTKAADEKQVLVGAAASEEDMEALLDLSDEDIAYDIPSLDSDEEDSYASNFLDDEMQLADQPDAGSDEEAYAQAVTEQTGQDAEVEDGEVPGEAVYTSTAGLTSISGARLLKEQTRARNKETLLEIINNANIAEQQKQEAVENMIAMTDAAEKEAAAEILLEARGFEGAVVTIDESSADVVVARKTLTDAECAQIEDIVSRKTGIAAEQIVINPVSGQ